jgi:hypothetical protein
MALGREGRTPNREVTGHALTGSVTRACAPIEATVPNPTINASKVRTAAVIATSVARVYRPRTVAASRPASPMATTPTSRWPTSITQ